MSGWCCLHGEQCPAERSLDHLVGTRWWKSYSGNQRSELRVEGVSNGQRAPDGSRLLRMRRLTSAGGRDCFYVHPDRLREQYTQF